MNHVVWHGFQFMDTRLCLCIGDIWRGWYGGTCGCVSILRMYGMVCNLEYVVVFTYWEHMARLVRWGYVVVFIYWGHVARLVRWDMWLWPGGAMVGSCQPPAGRLFSTQSDDERCVPGPRPVTDAPDGWLRLPVTAGAACHHSWHAVGVPGCLGVGLVMCSSTRRWQP